MPFARFQLQIRARWRAVLAATALGAFAVWIITTASAEGLPGESVKSGQVLACNRVWTGRIPLPAAFEWRTEALDPTALYELNVSLDAPPLLPEERFEVSLEGRGGLHLAKVLHAGDGSLCVVFRPRASGPGSLRWKSDYPAGAFAAARAPEVRVLIRKLKVSRQEQAAFEAEPNDSWQDANPLLLGRPVYGSSDDIEYLDNPREYEIGWDWFRIDFEEPTEKLVYFELDLPDRDIPMQLLFYRYNPARDSIEPYTQGKDPMEVLHDGQKIRYSKFISRVLTRGRYYLAVLGNHPFWMLRTTLYPVPPYANPRQSVETAMHYIAAIGDAWFAQIPRLGARHRRAIMLHDEAQRCTACHPTVFPLESNLTAFKNGYPIRAKSQFHYLMERVRNAPTPLYGNPGVHWVRFVAIELQFFGKQGGLLIDYENSVTGRTTPLLRRFTGFLQAAWDHRDSLPADENNGVSPIDSKFGFAWRDWRVLSEWARRTGDISAKASADHIEQILAGPRALSRIEGTQDRLHLLHGLALMNRERYAERIAESTKYFLERQNADGGWPGNEEKPSGGKVPNLPPDSVEYLTGQTIHTLLTAGVNKDQRARLEKGARWLMSRQRDFGGWFQTETIENFVTPMRETRYAIMALSTLYPANRVASLALGNRDGPHARPVRSDSLLRSLDDLDNLWQVPDSQRAMFVSRILPLLQDDSAFVRALAAQCLGRIGDSTAATALVGRLSDPVKMVWQSAAWALRQLGNRGAGIDAIRAAFRSPTNAVRRGAARVFAYQFYGMDEREDLRETFFALLDDPDLLTRHQAARTLSQWWYRTDDREIRRRIFQAFIDRLDKPNEHPIQQFNLSQGLYNLLDENLGSPGTGYGRWISYLKPERQEALRSERRWQEREILIQPILKALHQGSPQQRLGVLLAFDGTPFWRGYTTAAFGPGNDRAFDFESGKEFEGLEAAFKALLRRHNHPEELQYGLRLGSFFDVFRGKHSSQLVPHYLEALLHPDSRVREAAESIADRVSLAGILDPEMEKLVRAGSGSPMGARTPQGLSAVLKLLRSHPALLERESLAALVRDALGRPELGSLALPLMGNEVFSDQEALAAFLKVWPRTFPEDLEASQAYRQLEERNSLLSRQALEQSRTTQSPQAPQAFLDALALLERRPGLMDRPQVIQRITGAATANNGQMRQRVFELLARHPGVVTKPMASLVALALLDSRAEVRRAALEIAGRSPEVSRLPEMHEYLAKLLVDSDVQVRQLALALVAREKWIAREPRLAGRVKALEMGERDEALREKAARVLREAGLEPAKVQPTADILKPVLPDFESFRQGVNSYFYQESTRDRRACAHCHATHRIFRLAEPPADGAVLSEQKLEMNYRSLLKVVDIYEPESSLVLRKPLSPSGQGEEDAASPTGLTHVGGTRWAGPNDPAYEAILQWLRAARR